MMSIFAIVIILLMAYIGVTRGFFSSLLHMACVVVAGAIAFAFWEPLSYLLLEKSPKSGLLDVVEYTAWALGLIIPFAASLALLRVGTDKLAPANAIAVPGVDIGGAAICGAISGVIVSGILAISIGTMRLKTDAWGYEPVQYEGGSLQRSSKLMLPVDQIVGKLYAHTSEASFSTSNSLAKWRPEPWHAAEVMRINDKKGLARNTARPDDYNLQARYTVNAGAGENLLQDQWASSPQNSRMLDGSSYPADARIEGIILDLKPAMREPDASFVAMTEGQVWMVIENQTTLERQNLHPIAVVANPQGADTSLARFLFDSPQFSIASAGAASRPMAFEFVVPNDSDPIAIYVRNIRRELSAGQPTEEYTSVRSRDIAITRGDLIAGAEPIPSDYGQEPDDDNDRNARDVPELQQKGFRISNRLPGRRNARMQKGTHKQIRINDENEIMSGHNSYDPKVFEVGAIDRNLVIDRFATNNTVQMVQLTVSGNLPASMYGPAMAGASGTPTLVDTNGTPYTAVGWLYRDRDLVDLRYYPSQPLAAISDLADNDVVLSSSRTDQELTLLFLVSVGVELESYTVGGREIIRLDEPVLIEQSRR